MKEYRPWAYIQLLDIQRDLNLDIVQFKMIQEFRRNILDQMTLPELEQVSNHHREKRDRLKLRSEYLTGR